MDKEKLSNFVDSHWENEILPTMKEYIKIPNISPSFDKDWQKAGNIEKVVNLVKDWCVKQNLKGFQISIERIPERTPLVYIEVEGTAPDSDKTVLLYGHLDKQPEMTGWDEDKGPWKPVVKNDKLYGRGAADDGYAVFSSLSAIKSLQEQNLAHPRCVLIIESCEEGGSDDLPYYIERIQDRIGKPDLVICLDSGCGNYEQMWLTTSLRGAVIGEFSVELLEEGIHSGNGGGVVASSFRVMRGLFDRLEDSSTGEIIPDNLKTTVPEIRLEQAKTAAKILDSGLKRSYPLIEGVDTMSNDPYELILNRTWRASLSYVGMDGFPEIGRAGNVLRPKTAVKISLRIPPTVDSQKAADTVKDILEKNPPYNAKVHFKPTDDANGWHANDYPIWLNSALESASKEFFGKEPVFMGEGGSIPFMNLLASKFPSASFVITGVLGPHSNAHGPNEFLHLPTVKKLTCCVSLVLHQCAVSAE